jgi:hypothetical protein
MLEQNNKDEGLLQSLKTLPRRINIVRNVFETRNKVLQMFFTGKILVEMFSRKE